MILHYEISLRKGRTLMAKQTTDSFPEEREEIILDILKKQGKVRVTEVCDILSIAPSTARLLLQGMQDKGLLQRTHGGAIPIDRPETPKVSRDFSQIEHYEDKLKIAFLAASTIKNGDYITIGSGTTTYLLATLLHGKEDLTVVTDSFPVANELYQDPGITVYIAGGWIMKRNSSCRGVSAEQFFRQLTVDKSYCSADSIDVNVGTSSIDFDPRTEICVSKCGADRYVLVDSSKFHVRPYIDKVMKLEDIHHIITNKDVSEENIKALKDAHIDVLLA